MFKQKCFMKMFVCLNNFLVINFIIIRHMRENVAPVSLSSSLVKKG